MKKQHVWVVEMKERGKWVPVCGIGLSAKDARRVANEWKDANPHDKFKVEKYTPHD